MGGSLRFGNNSLDEIMPDRPSQSRRSDLKFLITQLYCTDQPLHEFCKAPSESAVSDSCLACVPTPGPSAVPGRSKKWGWGALSISPMLQTPAGFPWQLLVTPLIFSLPAGVWRGQVLGTRWQKVNARAGPEGCLWTFGVTEDGDMNGDAAVRGRKKQRRTLLNLIPNLSVCWRLPCLSFCTHSSLPPQSLLDLFHLRTSPSPHHLHPTCRPHWNPPSNSNKQQTNMYDKT